MDFDGNGFVMNAFTVSATGAGTVAGCTTDVTFSGIEVVITGLDDNTFDFSADSSGSKLVAGGGEDSLIGGSGNDTISGGDGSDDIQGGAGADSLVGDSGDDVVTGGAGDDTIGGFFKNEAGNDNVDGGAGNDFIAGGDDAGTFIVADGFGFTEETLEGTPLAVFFGFTHCPEVCPATLGDVAGWQEDLTDDGEELRVSFVTVDPERDTAEVLDDHVSWVPGVVGVTGSRKEVDKAIRSFRVCAQKVAATRWTIVPSCLSSTTTAASTNRSATVKTPSASSPGSAISSAETRMTRVA